MKKHLLIAVLILAVITSLTAGTLAAYNKTLPVSGDIQALHFDFTATGDQAFANKVDLYPGQSRPYVVTINNLSEVPVKFNASTAFSGALASVLEVEWTHSPLFDHSNFVLPAGATATLTLNVTWGKQGVAGADTRDCNYGASESTGIFTVSVNGSYPVPTNP